MLILKLQVSPRMLCYKVFLFCFFFCLIFRPLFICFQLLLLLWQNKQSTPSTLEIISASFVKANYLKIHTSPYSFVNICTFFPHAFTPGVPGPPGVIRVEEIGDTWVKLLWTKGADHNSPILYYTIQSRHYWALNEDDWRNTSTSECFSRPAGSRVFLRTNSSITTIPDLIASTCNENAPLFYYA